MSAKTVWYKITATFRQQGSAWGAAGHSGVDYGTPPGVKVYAPFAGTIVSVNSDVNSRGGRQVILRGPNGKQIGFAHLSSTSVREGTKVAKGTLLAATGNSGKRADGKRMGPHLHVSFRVNGKLVDAQKYVKQVDLFTGSRAAPKPPASTHRNDHGNGKPHQHTGHTKPHTHAHGAKKPAAGGAATTPSLAAAAAGGAAVAVGTQGASLLNPFSGALDWILTFIERGAVTFGLSVVALGLVLLGAYMFARPEKVEA